MVFGEPAFRDRRVGIDDAKHLLGNAQRHRRHRAHTLQHHRCRWRTSDRVARRDVNTDTANHHFVKHVATNANLAHFANTIPQPRDSHSQIFTALVAHHDQTTIGRHCFNTCVDDLFERSFNVADASNVMPA